MKYNQDPIFIPIQSPPFQRIPTSDDAPPSLFNEKVGFLRLEIAIRREDILNLFSLILIVMIFIPLCLRLKKRLKEPGMRNVRRCIQIIFTALNICWIAGCLFLLTLSAHIFLLNNDDKVERIERIFPWYIITIVSCCFIELIEALFGLNRPAEDSHTIRFVKSTPLCKDGLTDDEKLLIA